MQCSQEGLDLIKNFECCASKVKGHNVLFKAQDLHNTNAMVYPYLCPAQKYTIGWGIVCQKGQYENGITLNECNFLLTNHIENLVTQINHYLKVDLSQAQLDALISFVYNVGIGNLAKSTLLKIINSNPNDLPAIQSELIKWRYVQKRELTGLRRRREAEFQLYAKNILSMPTQISETSSPISKIIDDFLKFFILSI